MPVKTTCHRACMAHRIFEAISCGTREPSSYEVGAACRNYTTSQAYQAGHRQRLLLLNVELKLRR